MVMQCGDVGVVVVVVVVVIVAGVAALADHNHLCCHTSKGLYILRERNQEARVKVHTIDLSYPHCSTAPVLVDIYTTQYRGCGHADRQAETGGKALQIRGRAALHNDGSTHTHTCQRLEED